MNMIKELVLITIGSPYKVETWSGVPFFFIKELERKQIKVNVIDLEPNRCIKIIYNKIILPIMSLFVKPEGLSIYHSVFFRLYQKYLYKVKLPKYKNADAFIGMAYNLMIPNQTNPVILFSDWPFSYDLRRKKAKIGIYQKQQIIWENRCMLNASSVISLFPTCAEYINNILGKKKASSLGINVINNYSSEPDISLMSKKQNNKKIVFIGRKHYIQGAVALLSSYEELKSFFPDLHIDIIGMTRQDMSGFLKSTYEKDITFWGYLNKGNVEQCKTYYEILSSASLYVNTTPGWVGYTSMIEAMYFYTPVVVYPCAEFIDEFGNNINFGNYCQDENLLVESIISILADVNKFNQFSINAHNRVTEYTWHNFTDRLLAHIKKTMGQ